MPTQQITTTQGTVSTNTPDRAVPPTLLPGMRLDENNATVTNFPTTNCFPTSMRPSEKPDAQIYVYFSLYKAQN